VAAALESLQDKDFVYLHVEAPDEASHEGNLELKIEAIEAFDARVVGPTLEGCSDMSGVRVNGHKPTREGLFPLQSVICQRVPVKRREGFQSEVQRRLV
jgi:hypothetical protein